MSKLALLIYYLIAQHLPSSFFPLGKIYNSFRIFCLKKILLIGKNTKVQSSVYIGNGQNIIIGNFCQINERVKLDNVYISDYVMIAPGVTILGKMHEFNDLSIPMILQGESIVKQTIIEDDVWIGTNAVIMPGLTIASGSIIGAGAVLTKDTEENGIYGGIPAKLIKYRSET